MLNRVTLTLVFTLSFLTYLVPEVTVPVQLVPITLFAALVFFKVICSNSFLRAVGSLLEIDAIYFVFFLSFFILAVSMGSAFDKSFEFAVFISLCLILARLYMAVVPIREVLEAYFWSGIVSVAILIALGFAGLMQSIETLVRFTPFSFHPNLLAFLLAGYFCVTVWKFITGDWRMKIVAGVFGSVCMVIIFFASSRGSIAGILAGCLFVVGIAIVGARREARKKVMRFGLFTVAISLGLFLCIQDLEWTRNTYAFVDQVLQFSQEHRGIDSGFSGRFDKWNATIDVLSDGSWIVGKGIRSSDSMQDDLIDNGYLVILYEIGLTPLLLITWRFLDISCRFSRGYLRSAGKEQRYVCLACGMLMAVFLVNNIVARFLFSVGNPYSLVTLLLFVTPASRLVPCTSVSMIKTNISPAVLRGHARSLS